MAKCKVCGIEESNPVQIYLGTNRDGSYTCRECCKRLHKEANGDIADIKNADQWDGKSLIAC